MDFKLAVIEYALNPQRLFFIDEICAWLDFQNPTETHNGPENITAVKLRDIFINEILPFINNYQLTTEQKHNVEMLNLHPNYVKTDQGYKLIDLSETLLKKQDIFRNAHFAIGNPNIFSGKLQGFIATNIREKSYMDGQFSPLVLTDNQAKEKKNVLTTENASLLSLLLSSNGEMSNRQIFDVEEIRNRLKEAKKNYAQTGYLSESVTMPLENFVNKFNKIIELKTIFEELMQQNMSPN